MQGLNSILVVIDPTVERDYTINRASTLALATGARVTLFVNNSNALSEHSYLYEGIDPEFFVTQQKLFNETHRKLLESIKKEFETQGIQSQTVFTEHHNLSEGIVNAAKREKADLVIKSTHHHSILQRALITNTDWQLIRKCPVPLLLVKPRIWDEDGSIVTAVDPLHAKAEQSTLDHELLETMQFLTKTLTLEPSVFHSYFPFVNTLFASGSEITASLERIREQHESKMREVLAAHAIDEDKMRLSKGELVPKLIDHIKAVNANLLVIGVLSRNILERAIVGNTAERILEDCPCDVLVIKSSPRKRE